MRQRYFHTNYSKLVFVLDILSVIISLFIAVGVRSRFGQYLFAFSTAAALFPLAVFLRAFVLLLFDSYSITFATFTVSDIQRIIFMNLIASAVLLLLRLFSPTRVLQMPISMIVIEYVTTSFQFILIRTFVYKRLQRRAEGIGYVRRIVLWGQLSDIHRVVPDPSDFPRHRHSEIVGILTHNPIYWQTEYRGIRVFGDETVLRTLVSADDRISTLCVVRPSELTRRTRAALLRETSALNMSIGVFENGHVKIVSEETFIALSEQEASI